jgi:enhancing lycopene biosynthesis protein 2
MKKIAVILSGCGVFDGSEIHEATLTLLALTNNNAKYQCFAPNVNQHHVNNHLTGKTVQEERNVLVESARIARGNIKDLTQLKVIDYDAVIFPGGFGAAKNLSNYAFNGKNFEVIPEVIRVVQEFWQAKKPIGALCISPVIIAKVIHNAKVTIGNNSATINDLNSIGAIHKETTHGEIVTDTNNKIITSPCYMLDASISQVNEGVQKLVKRLIEMS